MWFLNKKVLNLINVYLKFIKQLLNGYVDKNQINVKKIKIKESDLSQSIIQ